MQVPMMLVLLNSVLTMILINKQLWEESLLIYGYHLTLMNTRKFVAPIYPLFPY